MSNARHRGSPARAWSCRLVRLPASRTARLVSAVALAACGACAVVVPAVTANAATETYTYDNHGTYTVTIPQYTTSFTVTGLGGAGLAGQPDGDNVSPGGAGGSGSYVAETFSPLPSGIQPGDQLQIEVGAAGGGSPGGSGDGIAGGGGPGGGYTYIFDQNSGETLLIAAGGGGGGGGSGLFIEYIGGDGGTDGGGSPGLGQFGAPTGSGGSEGAHCTTGNEGSPGQNAPAGSADGGGGGGGGGSCGGSGGQAAGGGGGGGGGSGYSVLDPAAASQTLSSGTNTGDGAASITFNTQPPPPTLPVITSATCFYSANGAIFNPDPGTGTSMVQSIGGLTATGNPLPTFSLIGQPSWIQVQSSSGTAADGTLTARGQLFVPNADQIVDGQYTFPAVATNSAGSTVVPVTVVEEPNVTQPTFLSAAAATATVGQPFSFQASAVGCPPIGTYSISQNGADVPWLTMSSDGLLAGTPTAADAGTHIITLSAAPNGSFGTPVTQSFTLTVNPAAATVPGAPVIGTATAGNGQATVAFTPPASDGGSPVTGYTVTATDQTSAANGGQTAVGAGSPVTIKGLTNGDSYTFTVKATNSVGTGPASTPSNAVTPTAPKPTATVPGAPVITAVAVGNHAARVAFRAPRSDGGSRIFRYTVTATDLTHHGHGGQTAVGAGSPVTIKGLTNGDSYTFTVTATNTVGTGPASTPSRPVTLPSVPGAPVTTTVTPGNHAARVSFRAPRSDGGSRIFRYTVTATDLTHHGHGGQTAAGRGSPITITGLTNGDRYTFTVAATNTEGTGPASAPSRAVTPAVPCPKPNTDLSVALTRHPWARYGSTYTETITVTNHGPSAAPGVVAKMVLPRQLSVIATHGGKHSGSVVSWTDGLLGAGKSVSFTVTVKVSTRAHGMTLVAATVTAVSKDPKPFNNWALTAVRLN